MVALSAPSFRRGPLTQAEQKAAAKAIRLGGASLVTRVRYGEYRVTSATHEGVTYTVRGTSRDARDLTCTCTASQFGRACHHRYAVTAARARHDWLAHLKRHGIDPAAVYGGH